MDFLKSSCQTGPHSDVEFGICDDQKGGIAFVDKTDRKTWVAKIKNEDAVPLLFTAIDKCVILDGELPGQGRCDAMLTAEHLLYLVELKDVRQAWREAAIKQLASTIELLVESRFDLKRFVRKKAFVCNRAHPHFVEIDQERQMKFYREHGFRLDIQAEVVVVPKPSD